MADDVGKRPEARTKLVQPKGAEHQDKPGRGGVHVDTSFSPRESGTGALAEKAARERRVKAPTETIEARLTRKAAVADGKSFPAKSLGQISRERRHKLLYGE
jgi:hypothetical protein